MAGAFDGGNRIIADKNPLISPLSDLRHTLPDIIDLTEDMLNFLRDRIVDIIAEVTGIDLSGWVEFLDQIADQFGFGDFGDLFDFFQFIPALFGGFGLTDIGSLDPVSIVNQFATVMLDPLGFFANLVGGLIPGLQIPGLDASKITSGNFAMDMIDGLLDALSDVPGIGPIVEALTGIIDGDTSDLEAWSADLLNIFSFLDASKLFGIIRPGQIPLIPIGQIGQTSPNLLVNPQFETEASIEGEELWSWDDTVGRTTLGSAKTTGASTLKELASNEIPVTEGQNIDFSVWTKWNGLAFSGTPLALGVIKYLDNALVGVEILDTPSSPGTNQASWVNLSESWTVPAGVDEIRMQLTVAASVTAGDVWFDDAEVRKPNTTIPQSWISDLVAQFNGILDMLGLGALGDLIGLDANAVWTNIINTILNPLELIEDAVGRLFSNDIIDTIIEVISGIPVVGGTLVDLLDNLTDWFDDTQTTAGQASDALGGLDDLTFDLFTTPGTILGELPDAIIPGLGTFLNNIFGGIIGVFDGNDHSHDEVATAVSSQSDAVVGSASALAQIMAALGPGNTDSDDFERASLGGNWTVHTSNGGTVATNGHDLTFNPSSATSEYVARKNNVQAADDYHSSTVVLTKAPQALPPIISTNFGYNDAWGRMSAFSSWATRTGVRVRWGADGSIKLSSFNSGTETTMWTGSTVRPTAGNTLTIDCGLDGLPRRFGIRINNALIKVHDEVGTASLYGASYLYRGAGGRAEQLILANASSGTLKNWGGTG